MNQTAFGQAEVDRLAQQLLDLNPDPSPRLLLLRDVLRRPPGDSARQDAERQLAECSRVQALSAAQQPDGTWGRFHTQDTAVKGPIPTSEYAIRRALTLGLDKRSPILQQAAGFIQSHLQGQTTWSDPPEKHDHPLIFPHNIRSVSAAMLALIDNDHPALEPFWRYWAEVVEATFAGGDYDRQAELTCQQRLAGIPSRRYPPCHVYYPLVILSATRQNLPPGLERRLVEFIMRKPDGIYYVYERSLAAFPRLEEKGFESWLHGQELLARFASWVEMAPAVLNWLWQQRDAEGLWDVPAGGGRSFAFPLSESWRRTQNRRIDWSVTILRLVSRYFDPAHHS